MNFLGTCRSGHHAILFWLADQLVQPVCMKMDYANRPGVGDNVAPLSYTTPGIGEELTILNYENPLFVVPTEGPRIVVLREIRNNVASWHKLTGTEFNFDSYRSLAKAVLEDKPDIFIYYDHWFTDPGYRRRIIQKMAVLAPVVFTDGDLNAVDQRQLFGSSFDQHQFDGRAQDMNVLRRYEQVTMPPIPDDVLALGEQVKEKADET